MASSPKHLTRRQRQRQNKTQPVLGHQEVAKTSNNLGSSLPRKTGARRLRVTQSQWQRYQGQSRLSWLRRLFGKSASLSSQKQPQERREATNNPESPAPATEKQLHPQPPSTSKVEQISVARRRKSAVKPVPPVETSGFSQEETARSPQASPNGSKTSRRRSQSKIKSSHIRKSSASGSKATGNPKPKVLSPVIYGTRLLILGIGLAVVMGTLLSIPINQHHPSASPTDRSSQIKKAVASDSFADAPTPSEIEISSESEEQIAPLKTEIAAALEQYPQLNPGVFILDLDTGANFDFNGDAAIASASTIKIPILVAFFQDIDAGKIRLDELLTMKPKFIATGSGNMQHKLPGSKYPALEAATKMITISDNTATNMLIERLGGKEALNQRFLAWGLTTTSIRNQLPDVEGTNTTSPKDLASVIAKINQGELLSKESRDRLLSIMRRTQRNHLLPRGLGKGATIAHKTGYISPMLADAGLIELPNGKRYIAAVMVKRSPNDPKAEKLIRQISRIAYQHFSQPKETYSKPLAPVSSPDNSIISPNRPIELLENSPSAVAGRQLELTEDN